MAPDSSGPGRAAGATGPGGLCEVVIRHGTRPSLTRDAGRSRPVIRLAALGCEAHACHRIFRGNVLPRLAIIGGAVAVGLIIANVTPGDVSGLFTGVRGKQIAGPSEERNELGSRAWSESQQQHRPTAMVRARRVPVPPPGRLAHSRRSTVPAVRAASMTAADTKLVI